jgi:hypothetical protein
VCVRILRGRSVEIHHASFGTFTEELEQLGDGLRQHKVKQVAMESTGVYWIPVWNVLERPPSRFELLLLNPQLVRALPGRKTDLQDLNALPSCCSTDWSGPALCRPLQFASCAI